MKTLTLLRHAKSGWDDHGRARFRSPLNAKGERAARRGRSPLRGLGLNWDHVVASPAVRVVETLDRSPTGYGSAI